MTITRLDDDTVSKIAAGEVVERPASVVKELIENSLDAGASRIDVAVDAGGTGRIRVADDGDGMTREEVQRAVEEHTTSKIDDVEDLEAGVATLGFRGEALYAIGAVSKTTITTRPRDGDRATELTIDHGEVTSIEPAGRPEGTTVEVTDLFRETPARRKFLKAESTEFDHVNRIASRYALANPGVAVSLAHDDRADDPDDGDRDVVSSDDEPTGDDGEDDEDTDDVDRVDPESGDGRDAPASVADSGVSSTAVSSVPGSAVRVGVDSSVPPDDDGSISAWSGALRPRGADDRSIPSSRSASSTTVRTRRVTPSEFSYRTSIFRGWTFTSTASAGRSTNTTAKG